MEFNERLVIDGEQHFMNVRHITLHGTNFEIGKKLAEIAQERHGAIPQKNFIADPTFAHARRAYFQQNYPIHAARMRGIAAAFGLDPEDDHYDFSEVMYNLDVPQMPPIGCSVVYYPSARTETGHTYLSRNYDFVTSTLPEMLSMPLPPESKGSIRPVMGDPYLMVFYPEDGGYASLAIHSFDMLSGVMDGLNSAGLVVSIMADEEALPHSHEVHMGTARFVGLHELQGMRYLLDNFATAAEAKQGLLSIRQYYRMVPCHYLIGDRYGNSFIYESSTGRNFQHILEGNGKPQPVTNFQIHQHPTCDRQPGGTLTLENNAFWRYQLLEDRLAQNTGCYSVVQIKETNACVNVQALLMALGRHDENRNVAANVKSRTLWYSLYDLESGTMDVSFYLGETRDSDGRSAESRSDYQHFSLDMTA